MLWLAVSSHNCSDAQLRKSGRGKAMSKVSSTHGGSRLCCAALSLGQQHRWCCDACKRYSANQPPPLQRLLLPLKHPTKNSPV